MGATTHTTVHATTGLLHDDRVESLAGLDSTIGLVRKKKYIEEEERQRRKKSVRCTVSMLRGVDDHDIRPPAVRF
jgi:hypothetical protein